MTYTLYIIRGLPGSGKSTLARKLAKAVYEEDDYWVGLDGTYRFDPETREDAFYVMARKALIAIDALRSPIALATAALSFEESPIRDVIRAAEERGYEVHLIFLPLRKGRTSIHNVAEADTARFLAQMNHGLTVNI